MSQPGTRDSLVEPGNGDWGRRGLGGTTEKLDELSAAWEMRHSVVPRSQDEHLGK